MKETKKMSVMNMKNIKPRAVSLPEGRIVDLGYLDSGEKLPLVIQPAVNDIALVEWANANHELIESSLLKHGAILFRGFNMSSPSEFERFALAICPVLFNENGEHPRKTVSGNVYTPVFYPPEQKLLWHNENSFNYGWPVKIWFGCLEPAREGGETPIVDSRRVFDLLDPRIREQFIQKKIMYIRNYENGLGLSWQTVFQTSDRAEVERRCRASKIDFEWKSGDRLRTSSVRPAVVKHPKTGEMVWFNQAQHWHVSCLDAATRESMKSLFREYDLPRHCYYGDGSPIEDSVMEEILGVYQELESSFPWRAGDILLLDNLLTAHARNPYSGERKLLVAMGEMLSYSDV